MIDQPKLSIVIPIHNMENGDFFLWRSINALMFQTFQDFEIVITKEGKMAENTNAGIRKARGELIKVLYLDDMLSHDQVLEDIVKSFDDKTDWMILGADDNINPYWTEDIETGNNHLGSPSALVMRNKEYFDENMSWLLDCDLYKRMYEKYGDPKILSGDYITIGRGKHQMTNILTDEEKQGEFYYLQKKYE